MKLSTIYDYLNQIAPFDTQASFDNSGLIYGNPSKEIHTVVVSLDIENSVLFYAESLDADLIISHHPIVFNAQKKFLYNDPIARLIRNDIAAIAFHTNFDQAIGGVNDVLCELCGIRNTVAWPGPDMFGRIGNLKTPETVSSFAQYCKTVLSANHLRVVDSGRSVLRIGVCSGSGGDQIDSLINADIDTLLTGEAKYHQFVTAKNFGINLIEVGHFATEYPAMARLQKMLTNKFPDVRFALVNADDPVGVV